MELIVFAGPSLGRPPGDEWPTVTFHPPAKCGDIARAILQGPRAIGLIDGIFETSPSPWHKEILWGLSRGITFFGAASIGALRAVELQPFGMIGVGRVFLAYRRGLIERDDEVAILHGPAELGYAPLTEAMVNIRASLDEAVRTGLIKAADKRGLSDVAKSLFYKDRTWERILANGPKVGVTRSVIMRLSKWLPDNAIDVKRQDARRLLEAMLRFSAKNRMGRNRPLFVDTVYFDKLRTALAVL
jgi:hypothetical protein